MNRITLCYALFALMFGGALLVTWTAFSDRESGGGENSGADPLEKSERELQPADPDSEAGESGGDVVGEE